MKIIYRISDSGYKKNKPLYVNNETCLKNFCRVFIKHHDNVQVIADNCSIETMDIIKSKIKSKNIKTVSVGHGAGTFNLALNLALTIQDDDEIIYFVENDYLHRENSDVVLAEGFGLGASFISLYDHPDKYLDPEDGGNPYCSNGAENTRVYLTKSTHWKITNSTTMTFASKVGTLKRVEPILRKHTAGSYPNDFKMFCELRSVNEILISPIPGFSTHGETAWMSPCIDWEKVAK